MKLIGSRQEKEYIKELKKSHYALFYNKSNLRLLNVIKSICPEVKTAYVIDWTPDQGEDIYEVLIDTNIIAWIELDKFDFNSAPIFEKAPLIDHLKKLKKRKKTKLLVALDLAYKDIEFEDNL